MRRDARSAFALVATLIVISLVLLVALALVSLASVEMRRADQAANEARARANARLALMLAIGQLQKTMGPDQRVSAQADISAASASEPHWTGTWKTTLPDGSSPFTRDDLAGGLSDARSTGGITNKDLFLEWLVSGSPLETSPGSSGIVILGDRDNDTAVRVPKIAIKHQNGGVSGHHAWWTGDLGVRANLKTADPRNDRRVVRDAGVNEAWFRVMASQAADSSLMEGNANLGASEILNLASSGTMSLTSAGDSWSRKHRMDFTVDSLGVIADVARGGLRRDLTAFFDRTDDVPPWNGLPGLRADASVIGSQEDPAGAPRHRTTGPRFGLLRDWARMNAPFSGMTKSKRPETMATDGRTSEKLAFANESPVKLADNRKASLQPILVEATLFTQISTFSLPGSTTPKYQLRHHHYPRVVLWNPYNVDLDFDRSIIMLQGNGRQEMWTELEYENWFGGISRFDGQWLSFEGGRLGNDQFESEFNNIMDTAGYNDPYIGSYYFAIPRTRFAAGECLVFSPVKSAEYDSFSPYRSGSYNLNANELGCELPPDPSRSYYISGTDIGGGIPYKPLSFWFAPTPYWSQAGRMGVENQNDDTRAILKHVGDVEVVHFDDQKPSGAGSAHFDELPQTAVLSASLQYGAGREPRVAWSEAERMPVEMLDHAAPRPTVVPNVRTREGIRLRWFEEHPSNELNSGALKDTPHFEEALLANWNPRAPYAVRSPWENIAGSLPLTGTGGGPWFFGAYTRDLYDQAVSWEEQTPFISNGRCYGNPFGPPQEGNGRYVLFDIPRNKTGVISMAQFQHANMSNLVWHPSYAIGNSLADPRLGKRGEIAPPRSAAMATSGDAAGFGGFHQDQIGWSADTQRSSSRDEWARTGRALLGDVPETDNLVYDLSFELNHALWDSFYLSTGSMDEKSRFLADPEENPLPNGRMRLAGDTGPSPSSLADFHQSASHLMIDGAFNVNSTRVEAWKALLGSTRRTGYGDGQNVPYPRVLNPPGGVWKNGDAPDAPEVWTGHRELTPDEIHRLAGAIVAEVRKRGPFLSLADFVNRRLANDETGRMGAIEAAIEKAGLNSTLRDEHPLDNQSSLPDYRHPDSLADATLMEQTLKPSSKAWGAPAWLTQADVLQVIGPALAARSDTFVIRAYGDAVDASGKVTSRAWCEAVLQRVPKPIDPDASGINPRTSGKAHDFGRHFVMTSFRWLTGEEI